MFFFLLQVVCGHPDKPDLEQPTVVEAVSVEESDVGQHLEAEARSSPEYEEDDLLAVESQIVAEARDSGLDIDSYNAPQAPAAPRDDSYGAPEAPPVEEDGYGAPQAPVVDDGYGAPQAPPESYGAPQAPPASYGAPIPVPLPVRVKPGSIVIPQGPPPKRPQAPRPRTPIQSNYQTSKTRFYNLPAAKHRQNNLKFLFMI